MSALLLTLPPALAALLLAAHFYRAADLVLALAAGALVALLFVRRRWAARLVQIGLVAGSIEWLRTAAGLIATRQALGQPFLRLALILGAVALFTALAAAVFRTRPLRQRYRLDRPRGSAVGDGSTRS
jgi:hypothetical protein